MYTTFRPAGAGCFLSGGKEARAWSFQITCIKWQFQCMELYLLHPIRLFVMLKLRDSFNLPALWSPHISRTKTTIQTRLFLGSIACLNIFLVIFLILTGSVTCHITRRREFECSRNVWVCSALVWKRNYNWHVEIFKVVLNVFSNNFCNF